MMMHNCRIRNTAWTLTELLVVIALIAFLLSLIIPAVQQTRESANKTSCQNHLRQISIGIDNHLVERGHYPVSGRFPPMFSAPGSPIVPGYYLWTARGSHLFHILPYCGYENVYTQRNAKDPKEALIEVTRTVIPIYLCPSRGRNPTIVLSSDDEFSKFIANVRSCGDYGSTTGGPEPMAGFFQTVHRRPWVSFQKINASAFTDGLSTTVFVAERYISRQDYNAPNQAVQFGYSMQSGNGFNSRIGVGLKKIVSPRPDSILRGKEWPQGNAGSAHPTSFNCAFGDGSVRSIAYTIAPETWSALCNRNDGVAVNIPQ